MKEKIKSGLIIVLIVLIGLFGIFGGKRVSKYAQDIKDLKYAKTTLETQKTFLETQVKFEQAKVAKRDSTIDSCMIVFKKQEKKITGLTADLNDALDKLSGITSDSSYIFLMQVAYNYPGLLSYIFNENQIKKIHADYLKARNYEQIIPVYQQSIANCKFQLTERDSIEAGLKKVIALKEQELGNCESINNINQVIIKDTEKQRDKERHRKNFWRFTTAVSSTVVIVLAVFGL